MFDLPTVFPKVPWSLQFVRSSDGVDLAVQHAGSGPAVLIANGIGVTVPGLDSVAGPLVERGYRVVCWDYRGMGRSALPSHEVEFTMARHAQDALEVLGGVGEQRAAVIGWSMGVPVALEMIRRAPDRVVAFAALFGSPAQPFRAAFPRPLSDLVHGAVAFAKEIPWPAQAILRLGVALPPVTWFVCTVTGFCGRRANRDMFMEHVRSTANADKKAYFTTMYEMMYHDGRDILPTIRCPVLVVAGENDWVTPPEAAWEMVRRIPNARHVFFPKTSHFGVIEHGPALWNAIEELLEEAGWLRQRTDSK